MDGKTRATPLFLCLVCIELSDFVFAVDSIPAVIGVSQDLLVVYSSNIFAILGLRSLYTLVAKAVQDLPYLRPAVALVLAFIGLKVVVVLLLPQYHDDDAWMVSLCVSRREFFFGANNCKQIFWIVLQCRVLSFLHGL